MKNKKPFDVLGQTSDLDTAELQPLIEYLVDNGHATHDGIKLGFEKHLRKTKEQYDKVPELAHVDYNDAGRRFLFRLLNNKVDGPVAGAAKLSAIQLSRLFSRIRVENKQFFPLRDNYLRKVLRGDPNMIVAPSLTYPQYDKITTACMTPDADLVLSRRFCQNLMNFSYLTGTVTESKKYKSNGGKIPDEYHHIETVIVHEFLHYTHGDFHLGEILDEDDDVINYATDYRSNYKMTKEGHMPLPMGLYSPYLNYDQQSTMREMVDMVKALLEKIAPEEKPDGTDEHYNSYGEQTNQLPNPAANPDGDEGEDDEGEDGEDDGSVKPKPSPTKSKAKKPGRRRRKGSSIEGEGTELDKTIRRVLRRVNEENVERHEKDVDSRPINDEDAPDYVVPGDGSEKNGIPGSGLTSAPVKVDTGDLKPIFNWKKLVRRAVQSISDETEESYAKISRRMGTRLQTALHTGVAVVKPGEVPKTKTKIVFVVDSSYSMNEVVRRVYTELKNLMKNADLDPNIFIFNFSSGYEVHLCNTHRGTAVQLNKRDLKVVPGTRSTMQEVLKAQNGGTELETPMVSSLIKLAHEGYSVIFASDTDVLWDTNYTELQRLIRGCKNNLFLMFDSPYSYKQFVDKHGSSSKNFTHWD